jgi:formylglycine-generating enzyme required for sulfatase activity
MSKQFWFAWLVISLVGIAGCGNHVVTTTSSTDGKVMVYVPAGPFRMGTSAEQESSLVVKFSIQPGVLQSEIPQQTLSLPGFYIDQTPVTNAEYKKFIESQPEQAVPFLDNALAASFNWDKVTRTYPAGRDQYPVTLVTWHDAVAYCKWAGQRLPTEAEWEKSARGGDGRIWPWGNDWDSEKANTAEQRRGDATPVGQFPSGASVYGALDMVGNVWQWTSSLDKPYPYHPGDGREDASAQGTRITRGGAWLFGAAFTRTATRSRFDPSGMSLSIGFRCAR